MPSTLILLSLTTAATGLLAPAAPRVQSSLSAGYIPDGVTQAQWDAMKKKDAARDGKLGANGPRGFKSRSMDSFVKALEAGEATHLMAVDPRDVKAGKSVVLEIGSVCGLSIH